jgi:hypothetical protein
VLLLRYSDLRIGDAVNLSRERIADEKLYLYTAKTGTPVWCPLHDVKNNSPHAMRHAKNAEHHKIELNWNVSGTRISAFRSSRKKRGGMVVEDAKLAIGELSKQVHLPNQLRIGSFCPLLYPRTQRSKDIVSNSTFPFCKILFTYF